MRFLSSHEYRAVKSPSKYQALDDLLEIQANYYRSPSGQEYVAEEVDALIWAKTGRLEEQPDWEEVYGYVESLGEERDLGSHCLANGQTIAAGPAQAVSGSIDAGGRGIARVVPETRAGSMGSPASVGEANVSLADQIAADVAARWPKDTIPDFGDIAA